MNYKRNEFIVLTGMTLATMKNYERTDRSCLPGPEDSELVDLESVRRFTPLQTLKTVLMNQLVEEYGMNLGKAHTLIEFAGKELSALSGKVSASSANAPILLAFHFSRNEREERSINIFGGYAEKVFDRMLTRFNEDVEEGEVRSGPCCILNVTNALAGIMAIAEQYNIRFSLWP